MKSGRKNGIYDMVAVIADNITSPLGMTTVDNLAQVRAGKSALCSYEKRWGLPEPFVASLFSEERAHEIQVEGYTFFESVVLYSIKEALSQVGHDILTERTGLIISTTKANVELIGEADNLDFLPSTAAHHISQALGLESDPIVVCNACISGAAALILAERLLRAGEYDNMIVCGCDVQGKFIVSGFQSLKALSPEQCRPFDIERIGLNLGEAAATIVLSNKAEEGSWQVCGGAVRNDAFHITNPSPQGVGCRDALAVALGDTPAEKVALINAHGTATMYNDQMESKAIDAAGLTSIPVNGLKGYFGHTMGAAGLLETIISMHALDCNVLLGTRGFSEIGVSGKINVLDSEQETKKNCFLKAISGFGGCNAVVKLERGNSANECISSRPMFTKEYNVKINPEGIFVNGKKLATDGNGKDMLKNAYKNFVGNYPKFYKMDLLSQLGFLGAELLLQAEGQERFLERSDRAVVFFNNSSSYCADKEYQHSIANKDEFFPSPSVFVYTLPNIVTGEIAIRNKYHAETSFFILQGHDEKLMDKILCTTFQDKEINSIVGGWVNAYSNDDFEAELSIIKRLQ